MSDEEEFEDVEEGQPTVEVLPPPPPPRQWNWVKLVGVGLGFVLAWHAVDRIGDRFGNPKPAAPVRLQAAAVMPEAPPIPRETPPMPRERPREITRMIDQAEAPAPSESWKPQLRLHEPLFTWKSQEPPHEPREAMQEPEDELEQAMRERRVLPDWGPPPCPPRYHHRRDDRSLSCWPN